MDGTIINNKTNEIYEIEILKHPAKIIEQYREGFERVYQTLQRERELQSREGIHLNSEIFSLLRENVPGLFEEIETEDIEESLVPLHYFLEFSEGRNKK